MGTLHDKRINKLTLLKGKLNFQREASQLIPGLKIIDMRRISDILELSVICYPSIVWEGKIDVYQTF